MTKWSTESTFAALPPSNEVIEETALAMAQATIQGALNASRTSRADLAERMRRPRSFITKMLKGDHNLTIRTFARALAGCGYELRFTYLPIESSTIVALPEEEYRAINTSSDQRQTNSNFALAA